MADVHQSSDVPLAVIVVTMFSSLCSILGAIIILITHTRITEIKNNVRQLLVYLTIADLLTSCGNFSGALRYLVIDVDRRDEDDSLCIGQSFVTTFSSMASFMWTTIIAMHLFITVIYRRNVGVQAAYHVTAWALPGLITCIAMVMNKLGRDHIQISGGNDTTLLATGPWCWIKTDDEAYLTGTDILWMVISGKGWEVLTYLLSAAFYMVLIVFTWRERRQNPTYRWNDFAGDLRNEERFRLTWLVLYALRIWGTVRFFIAIRGHPTQQIQEADKVLLYFHGYGDSGQAFYNFLIFCLFDKRVRHRMNVCRKDGPEYTKLLQVYNDTHV